LFGEPVVKRGIGFNLRFLKKKSDRGDNPDFDDKFIGLENGVWITDEPHTPEDIHDKGASNDRDILALEALRAVASTDGWASGEMDSPWAVKSIEFGIATTDNLSSQKRAFRRARDNLHNTGQVERCLKPGQQFGLYRAIDDVVVAFKDKTA
jgi:hypothetical protein